MIRALHVFPLFGPELTNGSERYAYQLTHALARLPVSVEVATTQARQMRLPALFAAQWRNEYPGGLDTQTGINVWRFPVTVRLPRLMGRVLSVFIWRRWQREGISDLAQTVSAPERAALVYQCARARPRLYHWLTL